MVATLDFSELADIVNDTSIYKSPMSHDEWPKPAMVAVFKVVFSVLQEFRYHRSFTSDDGQNIALEFSAQFGGHHIKGIDLIHFADDGTIVGFEVMIRPLASLQAFGAEMMARLAAPATT
jgi:hypothetical protein